MEDIYNKYKITKNGLYDGASTLAGLKDNISDGKKDLLNLVLQGSFLEAKSAYKKVNEQKKALEYFKPIIDAYSFSRKFQ